jgi:hypothetical protein
MNIFPKTMFAKLAVIFDDYMAGDIVTREQAARAALELLREPTDAMIDACPEQYSEPNWQAMIDAALADGVCALP